MGGGVGWGWGEQGGRGHQRLTSVSLFSLQIPAIPAALAMLPMPLGHRAALARSLPLVSTLKPPARFAFSG